MATVLNVFEEVFGDQLGPDFIASIHKQPFERILRFIERYNEFIHSFRLPPKGADHLRPYLTGPSLWYASQVHRLPLTAQNFTIFSGPATAAEQEDAIKQHLLYCHSVAMDDPLPRILYIVEGTSGNDPQAIDGFANYCTFLNMVKPLVESGVLFFVNKDTYMSYYFPPSIDNRKVDEFALKADYSDVPIKDDIFRHTSFDDAFDGILEVLTASKVHSRNFDLYFPARFFRDAFAAIVSLAKDNLRSMGHSHEKELMLLKQLISIKVPNLADLTPQDIVDIREDRAFARWRLDIERALDRTLRLDPRLLEPKQEALRLIRTELEERQAELKEAIKKSRFLSRAKKGARSFVVGGLAALGVSWISDPVSGIASSLAGGVAELLISYLGEKRSSSKEALLRHYLLFGRPQRA